MAQGSNIGIIGAGPAGCVCAYFLLKDGFKVSLIDYGKPLRTILPTGGGRCNLAHSEFDFRELAKNYPRGEKFLYSVFSQFSTSDTLDFFNNIGIDTYTQDNGRIFPVSDSSEEVRDKLLSVLSPCKFIKEKALRIEKQQNGFKVVTDMNSYNFDKIVVSTGGHAGYDMIKRLGVTIVEPKPSLVGFVTADNYKELMGTSLKNVLNNETGQSGDILFTHFGVSGPLIYQLSSINARKTMPYDLTFNTCPVIESQALQKILNDNPHKFIKNILSDFLPHKFSEFVLKNNGVNPDLKAHRIDGKQRDSIIESLSNFKITVKTTRKDGETVTAGGVSLDKINPKTMESKEVEGMCFCGEIIDVDGFCGGFNLQNCWATAYVAYLGLSQV